jgi:hypothetical protein
VRPFENLTTQKRGQVTALEERYVALTDSVSMQIVITMPIYEDWESAIELCREIDLALRKEKSFHVKIVLIDDGSTICTTLGKFRSVLKPSTTSRS